jgi:serine/threonine-protein kinase
LYNRNSYWDKQEVFIMHNENNIIWPYPSLIIPTSSGISYTLGKIISEGGYAQVFEGIDSFGNPVAIKILKPLRSFNEVRVQWDSECNLFKKLRHPNIVSIYDSFIYGNLFYIVLERADYSLSDLIHKSNRMSDQNLIELARQLLFAIYFIHRNNVIHRDITIYNVLVFNSLSQEMTYKISDFGISKEFFYSWQPHICNTTTAHPRFTPPELLQFGYTTEQSDLYHLGLVLLYSLTGTLPLNESMSNSEIAAAILEGRPRFTAEQLYTPLGDFIAILLRRRQEYRYSSALEAWKSLDTFKVI